MPSQETDFRAVAKRETDRAEDPDASAANNTAYPATKEWKKKENIKQLSPLTSRDRIWVRMYVPTCSLEQSVDNNGSGSK